jgi:hypothetical protein
MIRRLAFVVLNLNLDLVLVIRFLIVIIPPHRGSIPLTPGVTWALRDRLCLC